MVAVEEGQAHVDFLTPTRDFMLREGALLPLPALQAWPRRAPLLTSLAPGTCVLACARQPPRLIIPSLPTSTFCRIQGCNGPALSMEDHMERSEEPSCNLEDALSDCSFLWLRDSVSRAVVQAWSPGGRTCSTMGQATLHTASSPTPCTAVSKEDDRRRMPNVGA